VRPCSAGIVAGSGKPERGLGDRWSSANARCIGNGKDAGTSLAVNHHDISSLIACPQCDALYHAVVPENGERAVCQRCHKVLIAPRRRAGMSIIMLALSVLVLVAGTLVFPFLRISAGGLSNSTTVLDAAFSFTEGILQLVSLAVLVLIIVVPVTRVMLTLYVLLPVVFDKAPWPGAQAAFQFAEALRPWSMAEIFALGCAVALIKVADLADLSFGPAFWMFCVLVVVIVVQDSFMCRWSVWKALDTTDTR
jgi:paraquat-inducible protein A